MTGEKISSKIVKKKDLLSYLIGLHPIIRGSLFGGDRYSCIDEAIILEHLDTIALATIAPEGEENSGEPTIVGFYVHKPYRLQGYGKQLLIAVINRCVERRLVPIRVDALSEGMIKICNSIPKELQEYIKVNNFSTFPDILGHL